MPTVGTSPHKVDKVDCAREVTLLELLTAETAGPGTILPVATEELPTSP